MVDATYTKIPKPSYDEMVEASFRYADKIDRLTAIAERLKVQVIERDCAIAGWVERCAKLRAAQVALDRIRPHIRAIERILRDHDYEIRKALANEQEK